MEAVDPPCHLADGRELSQSPAQFLLGTWGPVGRREMVSRATPQFHPGSWGQVSAPVCLACFLLCASRASSGESHEKGTSVS